MPENNVLSGVGERVKDKLQDQLDPSKVFSTRNLKKKRGAFLTCLIAALLLVLLAAAGSVYLNAIQVERFESALLSSVDYEALHTDEQSVRSFARETIFYLTDAQEGWNPQIVVGGIPASGFIPQSFRDHMATVKGWFLSAKAVFLAGAAIVLALLGRAMMGGKGKNRRSFSVGGYYLGALLPLLALGGVGAWAYFDFDGMWAWLHQTFIPDGIFNAAEPIMQLFPLEAFADYLQPVAVTFGVAVAVILALPLILAPLSMLLTKYSGKNMTNGRRGGKARRTSR